MLVGSGRALSRALREIWQETVRRTDNYSPGGEEGLCWDYCSFQSSKRKTPASVNPILGNTPSRLGVGQIKVSVCIPLSSGPERQPNPKQPREKLGRRGAPLYSGLLSL
jgi:hypothetical protein